MLRPYALLNSSWNSVGVLQIGHTPSTDIVAVPIPRGVKRIHIGVTGVFSPDAVPGDHLKTGHGDIMLYSEPPIGVASICRCRWWNQTTGEAVIDLEENEHYFACYTRGWGSDNTEIARVRFYADRPVRRPAPLEITTLNTLDLYGEAEDYEEPEQALW